MINEDNDGSPINPSAPLALGTFWSYIYTQYWAANITASIMYKRHLCLQIKWVLPPVQFLFELSLFVFVGDAFAKRCTQRDVG